MVPPSNTQQFDWQIERDAAAIISRLVQTFCDAVPMVNSLGKRMLAETGTRLVDWVDNFCLTDDPQIATELSQAGFTETKSPRESLWCHPGGIFPTVRLVDSISQRLTIKVESVADFLFANHLHAEIAGMPGAPLRTARVSSADARELWLIERHGCKLFSPPEVTSDQLAAVLHHSESFLLRERDFADAGDGFRHAGDLVAAAIGDLGVDWTCDLFFAAERRYWQSRNRAARIQKARQDSLGLGWANHDHHTYRSSRQYFTQLIRLLEDLGFVCRERFYGGAQAGWGAQVLEQSATGVVIFADVDLSPEEVVGDFAHQGLPPRGELGTVGLWCNLHGEAMLQAGLHHLECQFDFDAAREQLARQGIETMTPFTDMPQLKQAFTQGEIWPVKLTRIDAALAEGLITAEQAAKFSSNGGIGSHLEILERNGGYKGFNQAGISEIIRETDPRQAHIVA